MTLVYLLSIPFLMLGYFVGRRYIQLHAITLRNTLQLASIITAFYIIAMLLFVNGFLSESLAGTIISLFYAFLSGVSVGKLYSQLDKKKAAGYPLYSCKNVVLHFTPLLVGSTLIIAGFLRIGWAFDFVITPIRLFSGASLVLFGLVSFTLYITPNIRTKSILIIDQAIDWKTFLDYNWLSEDEVQMIFEKKVHKSNNPSQIKSVINIQVNPGERVKLERILAMKKKARYKLNT
ncbi:MAG: hypothetical protein CL672_05045 [Balneola sp.]|nr:hypothetical protein [Balneola sp.]